MQKEYCKRGHLLSETRYRYQNKSGYWNSYCKSCHNITAKIRYNPIASKAASHKSNLKTKYGLTPEQYKTLMQVQNGVCAICKKQDYRLLSVDHDHKTGKIRGLLCQACNYGLGCFEDDSLRLMHAVLYLA